jgi:hypothetical protein
MSLKITHKNSTTAGTPPSAGDIDVGEIAMNAADAELYTKDTAGNIRKFQNTTTGTAAGVQFTQAGTGAVERTVESKLQDVVSVDDGSTLAIVGGRNIALSDCVFYIGNNQLSINNAADIVITNCVFSYPNVAAISWEGNTGSILANTLISNCTFLKNAQSVATFKGFVYTLNNTAAPSGDLTISNCTFRNCYKSAITNHGTGSHRITIENCEFNGLKTYSVYSQSSTMYAVDMAATGFSGGHLILNNCKFRNLYETPIKLNSAQPYTVEVKNSVFANNGGTYEIEVTDGSSSSIIHLCNLEGDGTKDMFSVGTEPIDLRVSGYLKRWLLKKTSGSRNYVDLPFAGPTFWEVILTANPNPAGNGNYRALEANYVSVTYDYTSTGAMRVTDIEAFKGESPTLGFNMDVQAEIPTVGSGAQVKQNEPLLVKLLALSTVMLM